MRYLWSATSMGSSLFAPISVLQRNKNLHPFKGNKILIGCKGRNIIWNFYWEAIAIKSMQSQIFIGTHGNCKNKLINLRLEQSWNPVNAHFFILKTVLITECISKFLISNSLVLASSEQLQQNSQIGFVLCVYMYIHIINV
jgi:hypothetical protein